MLHKISFKNTKVENVLLNLIRGVRGNVAKAAMAGAVVHVRFDGMRPGA